MKAKCQALRTRCRFGAGRLLATNSASNREHTRNLGATLVVIVIIVLTIMFIRNLGHAAVGRIAIAAPGSDRALLRRLWSPTEPWQPIQHDLPRRAGWEVPIDRGGLTLFNERTFQRPLRALSPPLVVAR